MESKAFWLSKTFWVNIIAIVAMIVQSVTGNEVINMETQASILAGINIILRFITKTTVTW